MRTSVPGDAAMVDYVTAVQAKGTPSSASPGAAPPRRTRPWPTWQHVGYNGFTNANFFTKWVAPADQPLLRHPRDGEVHDGRVQGQHPQAHRAGPRLDIALNVGDQWSDLQGGYALTHAQAARTRRTTCRAPTCRARPGDADADAAHRVRRCGPRLERPHPGR